MILNDGALDGVRILKADTVEAMSRNQIGAIGVPALKTRAAANEARISASSPTAATNGGWDS